MSEFPDFTDSMHMRAGMMMDIPLPDNMTPSDDHEGMLRSKESMDIVHRFSSVIGAELADKLASTTVGVQDNNMDDVVRNDRSGLSRTPSIVFRQREAAVLRRVLEEVDKTAAKQMRQGFNEHNFTIGVLNSFLLGYIFGAFPQHFWLVYFVETIPLIVTKFHNMWHAKPLREVFYYLDLCWFLNFTGILCLFSFLLHYFTDMALPDYIRKDIFLAAVGAACGPLTGATALLPFVAFLFHDIKTTTGLFIHILPPFLMYTILWHGNEIHEAWPNVFALDYLDDVKFFPDSGPFFFPGMGLGTIAGNSIALYFMWFVPYFIWMVTIGMDLPRTKRHKKLQDGTPAPPRFDTVFHSTVRGGLCILIGSMFWGRPKWVSLEQMKANDFEMRDFFVYMVAHAIASVLSIYCLAWPCYNNETVHILVLGGLTCICVYRGAKRYTYYSTHMYGALIRKNFEDIMIEDAKQK